MDSMMMSQKKKNLEASAMKPTLQATGGEHARGPQLAPWRSEGAQSGGERRPSNRAGMRRQQSHPCRIGLDRPAEARRLGQQQDPPLVSSTHGTTHRRTLQARPAPASRYACLK